MNYRPTPTNRSDANASPGPRQPCRFDSKWLRHTMTAAVLAPTLVFADVSYERARVVDVAPVYETVSYNVPREQCRVEHVPVRNRPRASATAPVLGAVIGGAIGNALGHKKRNKQVGAVVGAVLGGSIGYDVSRNARRNHDGVQYRQREICEIVDDFRSEERLLGYDVSYRYGGEVYHTRMSEHPGQHLRVRVAVTPVG